VKLNSLNVVSKRYYAFGSVMIGREYEADTVGRYRFGFNGKEKTDEIYGDGNGVDFGARIFDSRLGRWLSVDLIDNVSLSCYAFASNNPVVFVDKDGNDEYIFNLDGTTKYFKKSWIYNLFHKHIIKIEQPNGGFVVATMQDQKNDPKRYQGNYGEGKGSNIPFLMEGPSKALMVGHTDLCDAITGKENTLLKIEKDEDFADVYSYNQETDGNVAAWMWGQSLDWGYRALDNYTIYLIPNRFNKLTAYNTQNFGNYIYGYFSQQLGLSILEIQALADGFCIANDGQLDAPDDQNAIAEGWRMSKKQNGEAAKVARITHNLSELIETFRKAQDPATDKPREKDAPETTYPSDE